MPDALLADYVTFDDIAKQFNCSRRTVIRWVYHTAPGLPFHEIGRQRLVLRCDLSEWMAAKRKQQNVR